MEEVKRLKPKESDVRKLFFASGNQCAYPECNNLIVNEHGALIGQICHIEAANEGGERFNAKMSNEERRSYKNLVLLCYEHHVVTNDVEKYSVKKLEEMKTNHEKKFKSILTVLQDSALEDITKSQGVKYPSTLNCLNSALDWRHSTAELNATLPLVEREINKLKVLTKKQRSVFCTMLDRSADGVVLLDEIQEVLSLSDKGFRSHIDVLNKYKFISEPEMSDQHYSYISKILQNREIGWNFWLHVKDFCNKTDNTLEAMIVDLNFQGLD